MCVRCFMRLFSFWRLTTFCPSASLACVLNQTIYVHKQKFMWKTFWPWFDSTISVKSTMYPNRCTSMLVRLKQHHIRHILTITIVTVTKNSRQIYEQTKQQTLALPQTTHSFLFGCAKSRFLCHDLLFTPGHFFFSFASAFGFYYYHS